MRYLSLSLFVIAMLPSAGVSQEPRPPASGSRVAAWVRELVARLEDPHPLIRASAQDALVRVGRPAIPALRKLMAGRDPRVAGVARRLVGRITGAPARARGEEPRGSAASRRRFFTGLGLSPSRLARVRQLYKNHSARAREARRQVMDGTLSREEAAATRRRAERRFLETMRGLLTPAQFEAFERFQRSSGQRGRRGGPQRFRRERG